ncbi:hypothetical protein [Tenacibaculum sp. C7A-26P2]|uniref:hypothetical protein n=1 Tax=Tenacibaculum sp. C7A-26P2 TaxID=3447504 RepID=UPI003F83C3F9
MLKNLIKKALTFSLGLSAYLLQGQDQIPLFKTQNAFGQIDFLSVNMPKKEVNMGFSGVHYNLKINDWSYAGLGMYSSISGIRGGFFTLGVNAGIQKKLTNKLFLDSGIHFGGGGGASAPDGGGAFILPHINLGYNFDYFSINAGYSYINFFDEGLIKSNQFNIALQIPLSFNYTTFNNKEISCSIEKLKATDWGNIPVNKNSLFVHLNNMNVTKGNYNGKTIHLAGFEFNSYLNDNFFYFIKSDGAYKGIKAGYMDLFIGAGYQLYFNKKRTNILTKFGIGAGGGGGVDTQGGFLLYPDISLEQKLFDNIYFSLNKGYVLSPNTHFSASSFGYGLKYYVDKDGASSNQSTYSLGKFKGIEAIIKQDFYTDAQRDKNKRQDLHQISFQVNFFLNEHIFVAGQAAFANFGDAGAYAEGIVGLGIKSNRFFRNSTYIFTQMLGGAAGGGGISTGQGLILKPSIGLDFKLNRMLSFRLGTGFIKAKRGALDTSIFNLGINYKFSFLSMKN